jgi:hypothetical protein
LNTEGTEAHRVGHVSQCYSVISVFKVELRYEEKGGMDTLGLRLRAGVLARSKIIEHRGHRGAQGRAIFSVLLRGLGVFSV